MKITQIDDLHADGGWRTISFLKVQTDEGLVGWSEFNETIWNPGLTQLIRRLVPQVLGEDPRRIGTLSTTLWATTRMVPGGMMQQAISAIENACLDIKAKALGVPVYALFSGPYRQRIPLYWSHCGTFRVRDAAFFEQVLGTPPLRTLDDIKALGEEARRRGWKAVKTNPIVFTPDGPYWPNSGFSKAGIDLANNCAPSVVAGVVDQMTALREGLGPQGELMLDLNFSMKPEGFVRCARALEPVDLTWLEVDLHEASALAQVRRRTSTPIASLEAIYNRRGYRPFLDQQAVDFAIIDVIWNGFTESVRIAELAEAYEVNVAPHNFYGQLANLISGHFCASVPNVKIMEFEADDVPWQGELLTHAPLIENGELVLPTTPGWGADVNEEAVRAHPSKRPR
ncbi:MAG: mandelate racemase/muconate lactonizing enzyme family protein [Ideonella sp.]